MTKALDLVGQRFGRLTVTERQASNKHRRTMWLCKCDCGNMRTVRGGDLVNGTTKSCGCLQKEQMTMNRKVLELTGQRFGRLTVVKRAENTKRGNTTWVCKCDCGTFITVIGSNLTSNLTHSCGCFQKDISTKHGQSHSRLYHVWKGMRDRCYNKNNKYYKDYGGRGITVCDEWRNDFAIFQEWALKNGYDENAPYGQCTIDRIDVNGNYCPENCRWTDMKTQRQNQRKKEETPPAE